MTKYRKPKGGYIRGGRICIEVYFTEDQADRLDQIKQVIAAGTYRSASELGRAAICEFLDGRMGHATADPMA